MQLAAAQQLIEEQPAVAATGDEIARVLDAAKISTEGQLLDALEHRRTLIGLSLVSLDQLSGLAVGHSSKCLSPARIKSPTTRTLFALLDSLAFSVVLIVDPDKAERVSPSWRPRAEAKVRVCALSPIALQRARPIIVAELARRAARPKWRDVPAPMFLRALLSEDAP
jgi:hypothetical protein